MCSREGFKYFCNNYSAARPQIPPRLVPVCLLLSTYQCAGPEHTPRMRRSGVVIGNVFEHRYLDQSDDDGRLPE